MKYAFFSGCVSKGGCPELYPSALEVAKRVGITLDEQALEGAACTGAGVLQEKDKKLGDVLNARTFAMAEKKKLAIMTICSTCQGVMSQARYRIVNDDKYRAEINEILAEEGLKFKGDVVIKHLLWILVEDVGIEKLKPLITQPLEGLKVAPFYGCYIVRPSWALGLDDTPERERSLEPIIELVGGEPVEFSGKNKCCGFPILTINEKASVKMVAKHTSTAKEEGADAMVTPCPLCHLNLDGYQPKASSTQDSSIDMPILHLPQLLGLSMGVDPSALGLKRHIISPAAALEKVGIKT